MRSFLWIWRRSMLMVLVLGAVPAASQPLNISASVAVTWVSWEGARAPATQLGDTSLGFVVHPALVVVWRGQPGWTLGEEGDTSSVEFAGGELTLDRHLEVSSAVSHGDLALEIAYVPATREASVNGIGVQMPDGHNVVLVDGADTGMPSIETLGIEPGEPERVEAFLGRSAVVREFARCDVQLPDMLPPLSAGVDETMVRNMLQQMLDERCGVLVEGR